jgi:hypothetical protein
MSDSDVLNNRFIDQLNYLHSLRQLTPSLLRMRYDKMFGKSKYYVKYTSDIPRDWIEQRMFYAFCMKRPCYKEGSRLLVEFRRKAREVLLQPPTSKPQGELLRERANSRVLFTKRNVARMPEHEVDGYLVLLGYNVEGTLPQKKQALWEAYNAKSGDLPPVFTSLGKAKYIRRKGVSQRNTYVLVDLILRYPKMGYIEFVEVFGDLMPSVTAKSFYHMRNYCRKHYGEHLVPKLKTGPRKLDVSKKRRYSLENTVNPEKPKFTDPLVEEIFKEHDEDL